MMISKFKYVALLSAFAVSACTNTLDNFIKSDLGLFDGGANTEILTDRKIEICWNQAELPGDGYVGLTPSQAIGLTEVEGASEDQIEFYKACLLS